MIRETNSPTERSRSSCLPRLEVLWLALNQKSPWTQCTHTVCGASGFFPTTAGSYHSCHLRGKGFLKQGKEISSRQNQMVPNVTFCTAMGRSKLHPIQPTWPEQATGQNGWRMCMAMMPLALLSKNPQSTRKSAKENERFALPTNCVVLLSLQEGRNQLLCGPAPQLRLSLLSPKDRNRSDKSGIVIN